MRTEEAAGAEGGVGAVLRRPWMRHGGLATASVAPSRREGGAVLHQKAEESTKRRGGVRYGEGAPELPLLLVEEMRREGSTALRGFTGRLGTERSRGR